MDYKQSLMDALKTMYLGDLAAGQKFKALAYKKVLSQLEKMQGPVHSMNDVAHLEGMGQKIKAKFEEIFATGKLCAAAKMAERTDVAAMDALLGIHGIGPAKARNLIMSGILSVADLRDAFQLDASLLTTAQQLGLKYYEASQQRIPRAEMIVHEASLLRSIPVGLNGTIVGSYRRSAASSGDIDMLITYKSSVSEVDAAKLFKTFAESMGTVYASVEKLAGGAKKWMGFVTLPGGTARRLDLLLTPPDEYAFALFYFTGSDKFNVAFRKYCLEHGYTLNEHALTPTKENVRAPPKMTTEEDIFAFFHLAYVYPNERIDGSVIRAC